VGVVSGANILQLRKSYLVKTHQPVALPAGRFSVRRSPAEKDPGITPIDKNAAPVYHNLNFPNKWEIINL
jgi:hypothetical protein